jgi:gliding motility-associated-like protein
MTYKTCLTKDTIEINLHPLLGLNAGRDTTVGEGYSLQLDALNSSNENFARYKWIPAEFLDSDTLKSPLLTPASALPVMVPYTVIATTKEGCIETDTIYISIVGKIFPYTGFTPNADGFNDYWEISNAEAYPDLKVSVFNRWGEKVFYSQGYDNESKKFDGTRNGKPLPDGTYYYVIESGDGSKSSSGPLTIVR